MSTTKEIAPLAEPPADPSNVLVETIGNRIKIRTAICSGRLNFGITKTEADALVALGLARIIGII